MFSGLSVTAAVIPLAFFIASRYPSHQAARRQGYHTVPALWTVQQMHHSLCSFVAERVNRKKSVPESIKAGLEEALDLVIQIEKPDAQKLSHFFTDRRFSDTTDACQKYAHLYTLSVVFFFSSCLL